MVYHKKSFKGGRGRPVRYSRTKKMVTGHGPTLLEKIASGAGSVARLATAVAPVIAAINTEHKYSDKTAALASYTPGTNDSIVALTDQIAQGLNDNQRIGNSILAKQLQIRLAYNFTSVVGPPAVQGIHCRMMLICWKENAQQNAITAAKLFESPSNLYSPVNKDYSDQFVVMKDKFFSLNAGSSNYGPQAFTSMKLFKNINWHLRYDGASGAAATQNHIYLVLRSSAGAATTALNTTYYSRIDYTDN